MTVAETPIADAAVIAERIAHRCHRAKRVMPVVGDSEHPTTWDLLHAEIDEGLREWEAAR